jgi:N-ethylmaleimide reductase
MSNATLTSILETPLKVGSLVLPNRFVMAPLTRSRANDDDEPLPLHAEYYSQRASAGLIISEGSQISQQGKGYPNTPGIYTPAQVAAWKPVTSAVHKAGGLIFLQLWHVGRISLPSIQPGGGLPVAPSAIAAEGKLFTRAGLQDFVVPRALETNEIAGLVAQYREAAINAKAAGFDGVEVHAANGYLIDQFLRDGTNKRTDEYGGSVQNRSRLLLEIVDAVCAVWGAGRVGVRVSPINQFNTMRDSAPQELFGYVATELGARKIAYLHAIEQDGTGQLPKTAFDWKLLRQKFGGVYIANGGFSKESAEAVISSGDADLVSFGKLFISNPDLPKRLLAGAELNKLMLDKLYSGGSAGYTDYPAMA